MPLNYQLLTLINNSLCDRPPFPIKVVTGRNEQRDVRKHLSESYRLKILKNVSNGENNARTPSLTNRGRRLFCMQDPPRKSQDQMNVKRSIITVELITPLRMFAVGLNQRGPETRGISISKTISLRSAAPHRKGKCHYRCNGVSSLAGRISSCDHYRRILELVGHRAVGRGEIAILCPTRRVIGKLRLSLLSNAPRESPSRERLSKILFFPTPFSAIALRGRIPPPLHPRLSTGGTDDGGRGLSRAVSTFDVATQTTTAHLMKYTG